ncbi:solute carrier family 25 (mitochondrial carrier peroxisomal membrane 34kda) member 17 [Stylonychia lemnae]|uniref:Solute carrier family 25 (Mitochondrial carrier peroxisomal membrane 34kda) member 17 n=1 Tax=Stylonychia lemnae TaxID=5949 RepID=A0A077ZTP8_STYLE|nr:solute carrier family 25 (mitochondrial carrier peroxisomal membrane 34kda) member 17 [Stylonychia lemnae]|eukprot:CDW72899.1 solute carrier family 25 (mitochondrial carrier peroxisomal membrane 34kda) member 17 [Stylonychia lemnae]
MRPYNSYIIRNNRLADQQDTLPPNPMVDSKNYDKIFEVFIDSFSGATGGFFASLMLYPLENFRTKLQALTKENQKQESIFKEDLPDDGSQTHRKTHQSEYFKELRYLKQIIEKDGITSLYKGLSSALIGTVFSYGIYFWWYRFFKNFFKLVLKRTELSDLDITIITTIAGVVNSFLTSPIWFINARMATSKDKKGLIQTILEIYKTEGISAFYKGVLPSMILVLNPIINFVVYENLKKILLKNEFSLNLIQLLLISSVAKTIATIFTYPILTVRVKLQTNKEEQRVSTLRFVLDLLKESGLEGLYLGVYAKLFQTVLYNGFLMVAYERLRLLIKYMLFQYLKRRKLITEQ